MASVPGAPAGRDPRSINAESGAWLELLEHSAELNRLLVSAALALADVRLELGMLAFIEGAGTVADETRRRTRTIMDDLGAAQTELECILRTAEARCNEVSAEAGLAS